MNQASSPAKRRHDTLTKPVSARKRQKTLPSVKVELPDTSSAADPSLPSIPKLLYTMGTPEHPAPDFPTVPVTVLPLTGMQRIEEEARQLSIKRREAWKAGKGTDKAYTRQLKRYEDWWEEDQARRKVAEGAAYEGENAHPITAAKVILYLEYETTRPKESAQGPIEGSRVGPGTISQVITALESYRKIHKDDPKYLASKSSQVPLRDSADITLVERAAKANEPKRQAESQEMKKFGATSQTFTEPQLFELSMSYFEDCRRSPKEIHTAMRDRTMLLFSSSMAFRGDDTRSILLSDLGYQEVPMLDMGLDSLLPSLRVFSNQGKTNTNGRVDIVGTFRHRHAELCGVGALAFYLFAQYQIANEERPKFEPNFDTAAGGTKSGYRKWYDLVLFAGSSAYEEMSGENQRRRFNSVKAAKNMYFKKVTHAGRPHAATKAVAAGAATESVKAIGLWSTPGSFSCYNRAVPVDAMIGLCGFNARNLESYTLLRDALGPPDNLLTKVFPWIEEEEVLLSNRISIHGKNGHDDALDSFLKLLRFLRRVLLQDAAVLCLKFPSLIIFTFHPFNTPEFYEFSLNMRKAIELADLSARQQSDNLPAKLGEALKGTAAVSLIRQEQTRITLESMQHTMQATFDSFSGILEDGMRILGSGNAKKRKNIDDLISQRSANRPRVERSEGSVTLSFTPVAEETEAPLGPSVPAALAPFATVSLPGRVAPLNFSASVSPSIPPTSAPVPPSLAPHPPQTIVSGNGNVYSSITFPMDFSNHDLRAKQMKELTALEELFSPEALKQHIFEWDTEHEDWLPEFEEFWKPSPKGVPLFSDIWREYKHGIGGLSLEQLTKRWDARWKHGNKGLYTEGSRRLKVVSLIFKLAEQDGWTPERAVRFLEDEYRISSSSPHAFCRSLRKFITALQARDQSVADNIVASSVLYAGL